MVPNRLSEQLTALPKLMQPVVAALKGPPGLVIRALRVLDTWIDSLNPEFLEPAMAPVSKYAAVHPKLLCTSKGLWQLGMCAWSGIHGVAFTGWHTGSALRVLDTWVDSVKPKSLEPTMAPISKCAASHLRCSRWQSGTCA